MEKEFIGRGTTVEDARLDAIKTSGAPESAAVNYEVLTFPQKKVLGLFGGLEAVVKVIMKLPDEKSEPVKETAQKKTEKPQSKKTDKAKKTVKSEKNTETKKDDFIETQEYSETRAYIKGILNGIANDDFTVKTFENGNAIRFSLDVSDDDYGRVVGRRGETLDAIQYLVKINTNKSENSHKRVSVDAGGYRRKRKQSLEKLAVRKAQKAVETGNCEELEPMDAYQRRVIHTAVGTVSGATSFSIGSGVSRRIVIGKDGTTIENYRETLTKRHGRYGGNNRSGRSGRRPQRAEKYVPQISPDRKPKSDFEGSVYGKITLD